MSLVDSIDPAFQGKTAKTVTISVDKHGFDVRPPFGPKGEVQRAPTSVSVKNYFRHRAAGKDDKVFYALEAEKGQPHKASLLAIEYNGIGKSELVDIAAEMSGGAITAKTGSAGAGVLVSEGIPKAVAIVQRLLVGKWEPSAMKVIDALGARLAKEV